MLNDKWDRGVMGGINKKGVILAFSGYVIWGCAPLFWGLTAHIDPMLTLVMRIFWSAAFATGILALTGRLPELKALLLNKKKMRILAPAVLFLLGDWGVFLYAVQSGHVLDTSLGYYISPFVVFALSMIVFREKPTVLMLAAMSLAFAGVAVSAIHYGRFPIISVLLSLMFSIYGAFKKTAQVEGVLSIAAETAMMVPLALAALLLSPLKGALAANTFTDHMLFVGAGVMTALPMFLYSSGVIDIPFVMIGFMQYVGPTLSMFCGLLMGEVITPDKLLTFAFIWAAMALYAISVVIGETKKKRAGGQTVQT